MSSLLVEECIDTANRLYANESDQPSQAVLEGMMKTTAADVAPAVGIIMGSDSDWKTMCVVAKTLHSLGITYEPKVVSAHRSPDYLFEYAEAAEGRGFKLIIAGAGGAAHLPGMTASKTIVPVIGVPVEATPLKGVDALLSIMQMPAEVGVATVDVGQTGALHAALFAATILARDNVQLTMALRNQRTDLLPEVKVRQAKAGQASKQRVVLLSEDESSFKILHYTEEQLKTLDIEFISRTVNPLASAAELLNIAETEEAAGTGAFIASSSRGIDLAYKIASTTMLPVLGVPIISEPFTCVDDFLKPFFNMPSGVATFAVGKPGAINAALFAATILSPPDSPIRAKLRQKRLDQIARVMKMTVG